MRSFILIILLGAACGFIDSRLRPFDLSIEERLEAAPTPTPGETPGESSERVVSVAAAVALYEDPGTVFLDASSSKDFRSGQIPGSFNIGPDAFGTGMMPEELSLFSRSATVVVYCRSSKCDAAEYVVLRLMDFGFSDVRLFREGYVAWKAAGHPIKEDQR